ncbi:RNA binding motif protein 11 [Scleropages formosus]|uniref:RNA binding motif protein 11 n=1 Tax=Scleropages formosus TaxID=113540 RepID=UPI0010FA80FD|nr:splicing regulator RBM11 [Scleropages formosus]
MLDTQYEKERTVFVGNLCASVTEEILFELFLQAGPLKKVAIARDKEGQQKSYGFVCFKHRESVPYAIALLDGIWLYGQPIRLKHRYGSHGGGHDHSDPLWPDQSALDNFPEPSVFHFPGFPGFPGCSPLQDQLYWNMVCGRSSQQYPPGVPPLQYWPPPLHWLGSACPRWELVPPRRNPPSLLSIVTHEAVEREKHTGKAECGKERRRRKVRESRRKHRQQVVQRKPATTGDEV